MKRIISAEITRQIVTPIKESICACGYKLDGATHPTDFTQKPGPGDLSFCLMCGALGRYAADMSVVTLSKEEVDEAMKDPVTLSDIKALEGARLRIVEGANVRH